MTEHDDVHLDEQEAAQDEGFAPSKAPYPKVAAAAAAGALATLIVGVLALAGVEVPETLAAALATVLAFAAGYLRTE